MGLLGLATGDGTIRVWLLALHHRESDLYSSGMSHADDRLTALKGTGFSPYIKPAKSRGL
jgi:hypothetical protein